MLLAIVQGIALVPLYLKYIGAAQYGRWLALGSMVSMLGLIDLGVTSLVVQRTAFFHGRADMKGLGAVIGTSLLFDLIASICILIGGAAFSFWLPQWIGAAGEQAKTLQIAFQYATVDVMLMLLVSMSGSILFGIQKPDAHMAGVFVGTTISIGLSVFLLLQGWGILAIVLGSLARPVIALPINIFSIVKNLRHVLDRSILKISPAMTTSFFSSALWLGPSKVAEAMTSQVDNIIVVKILQPIDVTILNLTRKAGEMAVHVVGRLSASFLSGLAHMKGAGNVAALQSTIANLFLVSGYAASGILCGVLILNEIFVTLWTSSSMYAGTGITLLICIYCLLKILRITLYNVTFANGDVRVTSISSLVEALIQAILGAILCRLWGLIGVVVAAIVAVMAGGLIQLLALLRTYKFSVTLLRTGIGKLALASSITLVAGYYLRTWSMPQSWMGLIVLAAGMMVLFFLSALILEPRFRNALINRSV